MLLTRTLLFSALLSLSCSAFAADGDSGKASPTAQAPSDKLDVSDLEKKYWASKDTDFSVVQNRAYSKANRFALALMYGPIINDSYSDGFGMNFSAQYFLTERSGIELQALWLNSKNSDTTNAFIGRYDTAPNFDRTKSYYGVNYNWVPVYAKMSLLNSKILYFDMAFSPGVGVTGYEQQRSGASNTAKTAPTFSFNVTQHFFLTNHFAIRGEFQNRWYKEDIVEENGGAPNNTQTAHDSTLLFGIDYFF